MNTLVVYTPAIPVDNKQYQYFLNNGFKMMKRAAVLGEITRLEQENIILTSEIRFSSLKQKLKI